MIEILTTIGRLEIGWLLLPVLAWTALASGALLVLHYRRSPHPLVRYRLKQALLFALPATLVLTPVMPIGLIPAAPTESVVAPTVEETPPAIPLEAEPPSRVIPPTVDIAATSEDAATTPTVSSRPARTGRSHSASSVVRIAVLGALLLAGVQLLVLGVQLLRLRRLARTAARLTDSRAHRLLDDARARLGVRQQVELLEGPRESVPITFGWRRPAIVVPAGMADRPDELRMTLVHELVHIGRADFVFALAERTVCAVFAFHPLTWALSRSIERDREASCDAEVVGTGEARPHDYASLLYSLGGRPQPRLGVAAGLATPASHLKERIETMKAFLNDPASPRLRLRSVLAALVVLASTTLLSACFSFHDVAHDDDDASVVVYDEVTGWPLNEGAIARELQRLDAQVAYLGHEIDGMEDLFYARIEAHRSANDGESPQTPVFNRREDARMDILRQMYQERLREYETMKLEEVALAVR